MPLNPLNHHYAMENTASIYDEEALTALQLAGRTTAKVNETVVAFNKLETETNTHLKQQDDEITQRLQKQDSAITKMNDVTMPEKVVEEFQNNLDGGTFRNMVDSYAGNLKDRVDALLGSVVEGTTSGDAELIDARTGADGNVYPNAGDAIRTQYNDLLARVGAPELIWFAKEYIGTSGQIVPISSGTYARTDYIPVLPGGKYTLVTKMGGNTCCAFYNHAKAMIKRIDGVSGNQNGDEMYTYEFDIPVNCAYVRFTCTSAHKHNARLTCNNLLGAIFDLNSRTIGRTATPIACDSITNGYYANADGLLIEQASFDTLIFDVSNLNGYKLKIVTFREDAAVHNFLDAKGNLLGAFKTETPTVPVGAVTLRISNFTSRKPSADVHVYYDAEQVVNWDSVNYAIGMGDTLCIGDSLTSGACYYDKNFAGRSIDQNYPRYLSKLIHANVTNAGVSGSRCSHWWENESHKYIDWYSDFDSFIIWMGTNGGLTDTLDVDVDAFTDYHAFAETETGYYCKIIEQIKEKNPDAFIVLCTVFGSSGDVATTNSVINQIANKYGCAVVDLSALTASAYPALHGGSDNIHFSKAGNIYLANHIYKNVNEYFNKRPSKLEFGLTNRTN